MKTNDEILKYLSDLMTEREKTDFEKRLSLSEDLRNELTRQKSILSKVEELSVRPVDSPYFQNLLPRVRMRIEKKKRKTMVARFAYLVPTAAAALLLVMNTGRFISENKQTSLKDTIAITQEQAKVNSQPALTDYHPASDIEYISPGKKSISFEVGISDITNKEIIKTLVDKNFSIPYMDEYLLASK